MDEVVNVLYRAHYYKIGTLLLGGLSCRFQIGDEAPAQSRDLRPPQHMRSVASIVPLECAKTPELLKAVFFTVLQDSRFLRQLAAHQSPGHSGKALHVCSLSSGWLLSRERAL